MSVDPQLSDTQQIVLSILPIPSAIISILGSSAIIYLAKERRKIQNWTPYTRLLVAMSFCDIVFSLNVGFSTFLRPRETSYRIWAFGNDATCSYIGFINQASSAGAICYNGMLSFYFLLTARYGMKNSKISRWIEPLMHLVALGFAIGTALVGAVVDIYGEKAGAMSCWMSRDSKEGTSGATETAENDMGYDIIGTVFFAMPVLAVFVCLIINNVVIYLFVRRHVRKHPSQEIEDSISSDVDVSFVESFDRFTLSTGSSEGSSRVPSCTKKTSRRESKNKDNRSKRKIASQSQRLQLVCSQAFLFVMAFVVCNAWNTLMGVLPGSDLKDIELMVKYYPLAVLQSALLPLQGLFNMIIFLRPKYLKLRLRFPREGRFWTVRRIFLGDELRPTVRDGYKLDAQSGANRRNEPRSEADAPVGDMGTSMMAQLRLPRNMISSLTASEGDFEDVADGLGEDERWRDANLQVSQRASSDLASGLNRLTTLEAISELSETVFDLTPYQANGSHLSVISAGLLVPTEPSESRWKGAETMSEPVTSPKPLSGVEGSADDLGDSEIRATCMTDSRSEVPMEHKSDSLDVPMQVPLRRTSGDVARRPRRTDDSRMKGPRRKPDAPDLPMQVPRRTSDSLKVSDTPISVPKRTSDSSIDSPPSSTDALSSKKLPFLHVGSRGKKVSDVPLSLPQRFTSLPPSEVEEEC
ncbi:unnamed protein product [Cylindrotheca closterium]|uniref:G-protein coupled receptors family 1 profile domain-containing protein n=1 Tax=Cylindrotheca closterium TaxID=2856 RepID=A0AAD2JNF3_9STRA|nr:unnamed protein product [Cylindrotheca closterium]